MPYTFPGPTVNDYDMMSSMDMNRTSIATTFAINGASATSGTYFLANGATYLPFVVGSPTTVAQFFLSVVTASGNVDMGVYDVNFKKLVSTGSIAAASSITIRDVADYVLDRGKYYLALSCDNITISLRRSAPGAQYLRCLGMLVQGSAFPLPATATPVATTSGQIPLWGFTSRATAL